jgi:hypothetical protein
MEVDEILRKAWEAVENSGVPESLQEVAFKEAVETLRGGSSSPEPSSSGKGGRRKKTQATRTRRTRQASGAAGTPVDLPDEATFFSRVAKESGVSEQDLRDVLQLTADGKVEVTTPTRQLGESTSEQARTVVALVAGARLVGLEEKPINAVAVRKEVSRKRCLDRNFAAWALGRMKGFNAGSDQNQIVTTSKWVDEFTAAVDHAHGRKSADES